MKLSQHARSFPLAAFVTLAASACSSPNAVPSPPVGNTSAAIIDGTTSPASQNSVILINAETEYCSGTLIAPNLVLTARHCVTNIDYDAAVCGIPGTDMAASSLSIVVGTGAGENSPASAHGAQLFYVDNAPDLCGRDIALILLDKKIPGALITQIRATPAVAGEPITGIGYGENQDMVVPKHRMQRTDMTVVAVGPSTQTFKPTDSAAFTYDVPAGEIATSEGACFGDSGGPVLDAQGLIIALTSHGADPMDICVGRPDIYTAVAAHFDVINRALDAAGAPHVPGSDGVDAGVADDGGEGGAASDDAGIASNNPSGSGGSAPPQGTGSNNNGSSGAGNGSNPGTVSGGDDASVDNAAVSSNGDATPAARAGCAAGGASPLEGSSLFGFLLIGLCRIRARRTRA